MNKIFYFFLIFFLNTSLSYGQEIAKKIPSLKAKITFIAGVVEIQKKGNTSWEKAKIGTFLSVHDKIRTLKGSLAEISLSDSSYVRISESAIVEISKIAKDEKRESNAFYLWIGNIWIKTIKFLDREAVIEIETPVAVAGIRGTIFNTKVAENTSTQIQVFDGEVKVANVSSEKDTSKTKEPKKGLQEITKPYKEVKKPYHEVSYEEWCEVVRAMEQITIFPDGNYEKSKLEEKNLDLDSWVRWNKDRDKLLKDIEDLGNIPASK